MNKVDVMYFIPSFVYYTKKFQNNIGAVTPIRYQACMNLHTIIVYLICNLYEWRLTFLFFETDFGI